MKPEALWKFILRGLNREECQLWKPHGPHTELQVTDVGNQRSVAFFIGQKILCGFWGFREGNQVTYYQPNVCVCGVYCA